MSICGQPSTKILPLAFLYVPPVFSQLFSTRFHFVSRNWYWFVASFNNSHQQWIYNRFPCVFCVYEIEIIFDTENEKISGFHRMQQRASTNRYLSDWGKPAKYINCAHLYLTIRRKTEHFSFRFMYKACKFDNSVLIEVENQNLPVNLKTEESIWLR